MTRLAETGFAPMRAPASGSATERELPDVIAGNGEVGYAIEAKASGGAPIYVDGDEVADLEEFAAMLGLSPRIGVRFDREDWWILAPEECHVTDGGNYRVKLSEARQLGLRLDDLAGNSRQARLGDLDAVE